MSYRYGDIMSPFVSAEEPLSVQDEHFVACIATGAVPDTDGSNGLAVVEVLEAAQHSLQLNRPVQLDELATDADPVPMRLANNRLDAARPWLREHALAHSTSNGWHVGHANGVPVAQSR
jgi:hypothetical protein